MYGHQYTEEEKRFFVEYVPGHRYVEIQQEFIKRFGWEISLGQVKSSIGRYHLNTGKTGYFQRGHAPSNKGKKMPKEVYEKAKATMFKKGHVPKNYRPVGSERINVDGYIEIKVEDPRKWKSKHNVVWEQNYGEIPKDSVVIFLDGDKMNVSIENLKLIKRSELLIMNKQKMFSNNAAITETATNLARLISTTHKAKKKP